ncbi:MAG: glycoside hydrolase family 3 C-terminal domain-containing protein [Clostridiales bacterium]|nr:glycoside hydrolase family 3 C-terminal domain-containing protein [Clostridiales bacterium]
MNHSDIISKMTLKEKAEFCSGADFWHLQSLERLGIPEIMVTDGPHGLRKQKDKKDKGELMSSFPAVCFPTAVTTAASWDPDLLCEMGEALGEECLEEKVSVLLGPGVNIKRSPLCGRNFEYFSEDPYLAGAMGAAFVKGVQSKGIGTSLKHFAANNQETRRMTISSVVDERTLREIYLPAFEKTVKDSQPWTVMNAYNRLNGVYCSENKWLLNDVLRDEWGFEGLVVTDWGANNDKVEGLKAGQDLEMPSSSGMAAEKIVAAVKNGSLDEEILDKSVDRILTLIFKADENKREFRYDRKAHHALARKIAANSMVLLKNEDNILPLDKTKRIALIGEMAKSPRYQGAGSSLINPTQVDNSFDEFLNQGVGVIYAAGYDKKSDVADPILIGEAVAAARKADIAVVFAGLTETYEAEGFDRKHIDMPASHNELISAVADACENVVVVLSGGSPVKMPWLSKVKAVLNGYLGGQAGGSAIVDLLLGRVNPSGKLAETYPLALSDNPSFNNFPGSPVTVEYRESIYVGYRYYDTAKKDVLFPFGYGLSYTDFEYSDIKTSAKRIKDSGSVTVSFKVKNTGKTAGAETAQLYVKDVKSTIFRPEKELKGFKKVYLEPDEEKEIEIELDKRSFAFYNTAIHDWYIEGGEFEILVGASSRDIRLTAKVTVTSEKQEIPDYKHSAPNYYTADIMSVPDSQFAAVLGCPIPSSKRDPDVPLDVNNTLEDAKNGKNGAFICKVINKAMGLMSDDDANKGMMEAMALQIPIRCMISMSMGVFSEKMAQGLIDILNDKSVPKGLGKILSGAGNALKNIKKLFNSI